MREIKERFRCNLSGFGPGAIYAENETSDKAELMLASDWVAFSACKSILHLLINPVKVTMMTADPAIGVYSDNQILPLYYDIKTALRVFEAKKGDVKAVFYTPRAFPCQEGDEECMDKKAKLFSGISTEFTLVFSGEYDHEKYYIFEKE